MASAPLLTRRRLLAAAASPAFTFVLAGCSVTPGARPLRELQLVAAPAQVAVRGPTQPMAAAWAYGGSVPGPEIRARRGERLRVTVHNQLPQPTTVHWHGLRVPNAMDGVPGLTQAPIAPGARFVYEFDLPDAGTYWYHSHLHSSQQMDRGLYGPLIVDDADPMPVDRDLTWVLDDWRLSADGQVSESFGSRHDISHAGRIGNAITVNGTAPRDLAMRAGERIRLRLINAANARIFSLGFEGHAPQVIALDGHAVTPHALPGGRVRLAPGMRCDLLLDATERPGQRHAVFDDFMPRSAFDLLQLVYEATPLREARRTQPVALPDSGLPEPQLDQALQHTLRFEGGMMGAMHRATLNGESLPMTSLLQQGKAWAINGVVSNGHGEGLTPGHGSVHGSGQGGHAGHAAPAFTAPRGSTQLLALQNDTRWFHPIHLHGHSFRVLRRNGVATAHREWRDTVLLAPSEQVDIAFVADNPGDWMIHCHVLEHQDGGMMGVFRVT